MGGRKWGGVGAETIPYLQRERENGLTREQMANEVVGSWGQHMDGSPPSRTDALHRLTNYCLGKYVPDIVGMGSSVGVDVLICQKHPTAKVCQNFDVWKKPEWHGQTLRSRYCWRESNNAKTYEKCISSEPEAWLKRAATCMDQWQTNELKSPEALGPDAVRIKEHECIKAALKKLRR